MVPRIHIRYENKPLYCPDHRDQKLLVAYERNNYQLLRCPVPSCKTAVSIEQKETKPHPEEGKSFVVTYEKEPKPHE